MLNGGHVLDDLILLPVVRELRRARRRRPAPRGETFMKTTTRSGVGERHRLQQHRVDDRKDRGVGADAERERGDGRQRERRALAEHAQRVLQVPDECFHGRLDAVLARFVGERRQPHP